MEEGKLYDEAKFTELLFKVSRLGLDNVMPLEDVRSLLEEAKDEAQRYMGTGTEVALLNVVLDGFRREHGRVSISFLAHVGWYYYIHREEAAKAATSLAHPKARG
jgi:hypothetical protein